MGLEKNIMLREATLTQKDKYGIHLYVNVSF